MRPFPNRFRHRPLALLLALLLFSTAPVHAQEAEKPAEAAEATPAEATPAAATAAAPAEPKTVKAERGLLQVELALDGVLEAKQMTPIVVRPKAWKEMTVESAVKHGQRVSKGETLVTLDLENLDRAIADQEQALELARLKLAQAGEELQLLEKSTPLDMEQLERTKKSQDEDLQLFFAEDLEQARKNAEYSRRQSKSRLENEEEELEQLQKMYDADDLTEETEEIVLKRQREAVDQARFYDAMAERELERTMKYEIPRMEQARKLGAALAELSYARSKFTIPVSLKQSHLEMQAQKVAFDKSERALADLKADRELLNIVAPVDGVVYYGKCTNGEWTAASTVAERLQTGGAIAANDVFMTIVTPGGLWLRATAEEKDIAQLRVGLAGSATPVAFEDVKAPVQLAEVSPIPVASGKYDVKFDVLAGEAAERLVAGMSAKAKLSTYRNENAVKAPASAVFSDDATPDAKYVFVQTEPGKHEKRTVTVGRKSGDVVEITSGLNGDETLLAEKP
jgi:HlyD family secretion protein